MEDIKNGEKEKNNNEENNKTNESTQNEYRFDDNKTERTVSENHEVKPLSKPAREKHDIIDQLVDTIGYGPDQIKIIIVISLFKIHEGFHLALFSHIVIPFKRFYVIGESLTMFISGVIFLGYAIGALLPGYIQLIFSRRFILISFGTILFFLSLFQAMFENYYFFAINRFFIGICFGILKPIFSSIMVEFLPNWFRSIIICTEQFFFLLGGTAGMNLIIRFIMPDLKIEGLKLVLFTIPISGLLMVIFSIAFVKESPRFYFEKNEPARGILELERMLKIRIIDEDREVLLRQGHFKPEVGTLKDLFKPKYTRLLVILTLFNIFNAYMLYNVLLLSSLSIRTFLKGLPNEVIVHKQTIVFWVTVFGCIAAGVMCEINGLGRKYTMTIGYYGFALFGILACAFHSYFDIFLAIMGFILQLSYNITYVYSCEAFPFKVRGVALGFLVMCTRISGFVSHDILVILHNQHPLIPYGVGITLGIIGGSLTFFLKFDTKNRKIDKEEEEVVENILKKNIPFEEEDEPKKLSQDDEETIKLKLEKKD